MKHTLYNLLLLVLLLTSCAGQPSQVQTRLSAVEATSGDAGAGFEQVTEPRDFVFPKDHGPHQQYATEWWYYTGNLNTTEGRHFGYQLTFFRFGLAPTEAQRPSKWATANLYMAHFALTDVAGNTFHAFDRFGRGAAGLAGATGEPNYRVWLDDWSAEGGGAEGLPMRLQAQQGDVQLELVLDSTRPVVLQGNGGVSQKSDERGNASYYYSLTRLNTEGAITIDGERFTVRGLSWMDREFGTSALDKNSVGWDWFAIHLDDGRDLMYYRIRRTNGLPPYQFGTLVEPDGTYRQLDENDIQLEATGTWRSPRSGGEYPSGWRLRVPSAQIDLAITPYLQDQELPLAVVYWEGANKVEGSSNGQPVGGNAYVELTGYGEQSSQGDIRVR